MFAAANVQADGTCPGAPVGNAFLDELFVPSPGSPALAAGDLATCRSQPVGATDLLFRGRGAGGRCALGAFEQAPIRFARRTDRSVPHAEPRDDFDDDSPVSTQGGGSP